MKITFFSTQPYDKTYFERVKTSHKLVFQEARLNPETAQLAEGTEAVCLFVNDHATAEIIEKWAEMGIKLIVLRSAGFNHIDLAAAKTWKIPVVRVPAYSPHAIAEHAVALILTLNRKTHKAYNRVREGNFSLERLVGFDLFEKTVGVVGTGKIGAVLCEIMLGFGCHVRAFDLVENEELKKKGVQYCRLPELLVASDIVSLHCPLTEDTKHLINVKTLKTMKNGAMLINTGRGGLVNSQDVIAALKSQKLGFLGIDVYEQEENLFAQDLSDTIINDEIILSLMTFPNVLITAHQAYLTDEALIEIARISLKNVDDFEAGKVLKNEVAEIIIIK